MTYRNSKDRYKQFIKNKVKDYDNFIQDSEKLDRLWSYVGNNSDPLEPKEVLHILKVNNVKLDILSICKFFKITLKKSDKASIIFNKNNKLILTYRSEHSEDDIFYMLGHLFKNFLNDGYYFRFPKKRKVWDDDFRIKLARDFSEEFKKLLKLEILKEGGEKLHNIINAIYDLTALPEADDYLLKLSLLCNYYRKRLELKVMSENY